MDTKLILVLFLGLIALSYAIPRSRRDISQGKAPEPSPPGIATDDPQDAGEPSGEDMDEAEQFYGNFGFGGYPGYGGYGSYPGYGGYGHHHHHHHGHRHHG